MVILEQYKKQMHLRQDIFNLFPLFQSRYLWKNRWPCCCQIRVFLCTFSKKLMSMSPCSFGTQEYTLTLLLTSFKSSFTSLIQFLLFCSLLIFFLFLTSHNRLEESWGITVFFSRQFHLTISLSLADSLENIWKGYISSSFFLVSIFCIYKDLYILTCTAFSYSSSLNSQE